MREYQNNNVASKSLGMPIEQFNSSISGTPELWERWLAELLAARNDLVHHFYHRFDFVMPNSVNEALEYLDRQYKEAKEWSEILGVQSLILLLILIETRPALAAEYGVHREKIIARLPTSLEIVVPSAPNRTMWATARVVKLLRLAEQHTQTVDGMTFLSRAGKFIKSQAPDLKVKEYGLKTLKEILMVSGLFHVVVAGDGTVTYQRNEILVDPLPDEPEALSFSVFLGG